MPEVATTVFPEIPVQWDNSVESIHSTTVLRTTGGREQRVPEFPVGGYRRFGFTTGALDAKDRYTLYTFFNARRGGALAFYLFEPFSRNYYSEPVGTAAGSSLIIPFKGIATTLDDNPTLLTSTVAGVSRAFTVTEGADAFLDARLNFTAGAQAGATLLTANMRKRYIVKFETDSAVETFLQNALSYRCNVKITVLSLEP